MLCTTQIDVPQSDAGSVDDLSASGLGDTAPLHTRNIVKRRRTAQARAAHARSPQTPTPLAVAKTSPIGSTSLSTDFAPIKSFAVMRGQLLCGDRLQQVRRLQDSIARFGLLAPIVAVRRAGKLVVVDGRKRLAALRRLAFQGRLPRSLTHIPYLIAGEAGPQGGRATAIMSNRELYTAVLGRFQAGKGLDDIAEEFHISRQCVRDVLSLSRLDAAVRRSVFERLIDFAQASAFATIPDTTTQRRVLMQLGPFARPADIVDAAKGPVKLSATAPVLAA